MTVLLELPDDIAAILPRTVTCPGERSKVSTAYRIFDTVRSVKKDPYKVP